MNMISGGQMQQLNTLVAELSTEQPATNSLKKIHQSGKIVYIMILMN